MFNLRFDAVSLYTKLQGTVGCWQGQAGMTECFMQVISWLHAGLDGSKSVESSCYKNNNHQELPSPLDLAITFWVLQ